MTSRTGRPLAHALLWTGIAAAVGVLLLVIVVGADWPSPEDAGSEADALSAELLVHFVFGLVSLICLPLVLFFDGRRVPRKQLRPKVLAAEKLGEFLTVTGRGGEEFLAADGSVESLQRRPGGWIPVTVGIIGLLCGTVSTVGFLAASLILVSLSARRSWLLTSSPSPPHWPPSCRPTSSPRRPPARSSFRSSSSAASSMPSSSPSASSAVPANRASSTPPLRPCCANAPAKIAPSPRCVAASPATCTIPCPIICPSSPCTPEPCP